MIFPGGMSVEVVVRIYLEEEFFGWSTSVYIIKFVSLLVEHCLSASVLKLTLFSVFFHCCLSGETAC